jgi:hypothetical protein
MAVFPEEQTGLGRLDAARRKPADLLARSGLPVPDLRGSEATDLELFNTDFRRLVSRIAKLFSIIAPTTQGTTSDVSTILAPHHQQHEKDGSDQVNVTGLSGVLANDQNPVAHDIQGEKHTAESLTIGHVLRATAPDDFAFAALEEADIPASIARLADLDDLVKSGTGTPQGVVVAPVGTLFLRTDGGASTTLYVKESGVGNTGWIAK